MALPPFPTSPTPSGRRRKYSEMLKVEWSDFFSQKVMIPTPRGRFCCYTSGVLSEKSTLLLLLHGAGFTGLTWALFTKDIINRPMLENEDIFIAAPDLRYHGESMEINEKQFDLSIDSLCLDIADIVKHLMEGVDTIKQGIIVGHSMGGALAVHSAHKKCLPNLQSVIMVDIVEATAMESLSLMKVILSKRPDSFPCMDSAIAWACANITSNRQSAMISMPSQLEKKFVSSHESLPLVGTSVSRIAENVQSALTEKDEPESDKSNSNNTLAPGGTKEVFVWRIDLRKSEPFWYGWFKGLDNSFLTLDPNIHKVLVVAGPEKLDKELMTAQMQGKFHYISSPSSGHAVQEDVPGFLASEVLRVLSLLQKQRDLNDKLNRAKSLNKST